MSTEHIKRIAEMNDTDFAAEIERKADAERFSAMLVILERASCMYAAKKVKARA